MPAPGPPRSIHNPAPRLVRRPAGRHSASRSPRGHRDPGASQEESGGDPPGGSRWGPPPRNQQCTTGAGWGPHAAGKARRPPALHARPPVPPRSPRAHAPLAQPRLPGGRPGARGASQRRGPGRVSSRRRPPCSRPPARRLRGTAGRTAWPGRATRASRACEPDLSSPPSPPPPPPAPARPGYSREITAQRVG